jgi:segregation and condensation protein B
VGKPILYKTTKDFLVQFGLKDVTELPTLKEFEELGRLEIVDDVVDPVAEAAAPGLDAAAPGLSEEPAPGLEEPAPGLEEPPPETPAKNG